MQALLAQPKIQVNVQNKLGDTPLHLAAYRGHPEIITLLLEAGMSGCIDLATLATKLFFDHFVYIYIYIGASPIALYLCFHVLYFPLGLPTRCGPQCDQR